MRGIVSLAIPVLFAAPMWGQDATPASKTLYYAHPAATQLVQEAVNILRSVTEMQHITADNAVPSIAVSGTATQVATAEWLFQKLDQSPDARPSSPAQYTMDGSTYPAVRVFYLANVSTPQSIQEIVNTIRATGDIQRITAYNQLQAIIVRAAPNQIALAEWLIGRLDVPAAAPQGSNPATFVFQPEFVHDTGTAARVFYLANTRQPQDIQQIVNSLRSVTEIQRITSFNKNFAIVLRGAPEQAALAEWLVARLDKPAGAQPAAALEYQIPGKLDPNMALTPSPIVELFYLAHLSTPQDIQDLVNSIRTTTQLQRITAYDGPRAIVARGTGAQIAQAATLVQQRDKPAQ